MTNTAAIATKLNVLESAIVRVETWANVLFVVVKGLGARFVSKKVVVKMATAKRTSGGVKLTAADGKTYINVDESCWKWNQEIPFCISYGLTKEQVNNLVLQVTELMTQAAIEPNFSNNAALSSIDELESAMYSTNGRYYG